MLSTFKAHSVMAFTFKAADGRYITIDLNDSTFNAEKYARTDTGYGEPPLIMNDIFSGTRPAQRITASASGLFIEGTKLCGFCLGSDQKLHYSQIDLNNYYGNKNGSFVSGDRAFGNTAQHLTLSTHNERGKVMLRGQLRAYNHSYQQAEVNLAICIVNEGGKFGFVHNDGFWGADGWVVTTFESTPYAGFAMGLVHAIAGDKVQLRTFRSTAIAGLGSIGAYFGGPIGAALLAGAATPITIMMEQWVGSNYIDDPVLRQEFEEATLGRYIIETLVNMIAPGSSKMLSKYLTKQAAPAIEKLANAFLEEVAKKYVKKGAKKASKKFIEKLIDGIVNGVVPDEWMQGTIGPGQLQGNTNNQFYGNANQYY
ncbi:CNVH-domain-containing protein [Mycena sanguinolenta]|uniref:CNVH-domain-containing protein n=1 Tax=Mycena sanguinolenta TaxID=230812 RepID=A0A8H7D9R9_9AGAR|nr:CNVH-domain-containing protein [Mycena sanguinolenta]